MVGTDKVKTPPACKLAASEIKRQGKKHSVIQRLLLCQKPEAPKKIQVVIPTQIIYPIRRGGLTSRCMVLKFPLSATLAVRL